MCTDIIGSIPLTDEQFFVCGNPKLKEAADFLAAFSSHLKSGLGIDLYHTRPHVGIYNILLSHAYSLSEGLYKNRRGENCSTLVGANGM
jgi:hypothetical protein